MTGRNIILGIVIVLAGAAVYVRRSSRTAADSAARESAEQEPHASPSGESGRDAIEVPLSGMTPSPHGSLLVENEDEANDDLLPPSGPTPEQEAALVQHATQELTKEADVLSEIAANICDPTDAGHYKTYMSCMIPNEAHRTREGTRTCFEAVPVHQQSFIDCDERVQHERAKRYCSEEEARAIAALSRCMMERDVAGMYLRAETEQANEATQSCYHIHSIELSDKCGEMLSLSYERMPQ